MAQCYKEREFQHVNQSTQQMPAAVKHLSGEEETQTHKTKRKQRNLHDHSRAKAKTSVVVYKPDQSSY